MILRWCRLVVLLGLASAWWVSECGAQEGPPAAPDTATLTALADAMAAAKAQPTSGVMVGRLKDLVGRIPTQMGLRESVAFAIAVGILASGDELGFEVQRQKLTREYPDSPSRSLLNESSFEEPCPACKGEGKQSWKCTKCNGSGKCGNSKCEAGTVRYKGLNRERVEKPCPVCEGKGKCGVCKGSGKESQACGKCGGKGKRKAKGRARDLFVAALDQCAELLDQVKRATPAPGEKVLTPAVAAVPAKPEPAAAPPGQPETTEETAKTPEPVPAAPGAPAPEVAKKDGEPAAKDEPIEDGALPPPPAEVGATEVDEWLLPPPDKPIVEEPVAVAQATPPAPLVPAAPGAEPARVVEPPPQEVLPPPPPEPEPEPEADLGKTPEHLKPLLEEYGKWLKAQQRRIGARIVTKVRVEEQDGNRAVLHIVLHKNFFSQGKGWRTQVGDAFCKLWAEKCLGYQVDGQQLVPVTILEDEKGEVVGEATGPNPEVKLKR